MEFSYGKRSKDHDENKRKALESALSQIEKAYGKGSVMKLGDNMHLNVETVPSGSLGLVSLWVWAVCQRDVW